MTIEELAALKPEDLVRHRFSGGYKVFCRTKEDEVIVYRLSEVTEPEKWQKLDRLAHHTEPIGPVRIEELQPGDAICHKYCGVYHVSSRARNRVFAYQLRRIDDPENWQIVDQDLSKSCYSPKMPPLPTKPDFGTCR